jgi:hypothetical protein
LRGKPSVTLHKHLQQPLHKHQLRRQAQLQQHAKPLRKLLKWFIELRQW